MAPSKVAVCQGDAAVFFAEACNAPAAAVGGFVAIVVGDVIGVGVVLGAVEVGFTPTDFIPTTGAVPFFGDV